VSDGTADERGGGRQHHGYGRERRARGRQRHLPHARARYAADNPGTGRPGQRHTDVEGSSLTAQIVSGPSNGTLSLSLDGSFNLHTRPTVSGLTASPIALRTQARPRTRRRPCGLSPTAWSGLRTCRRPSSARRKTGSTVRMKWQFKDGSQVANSYGVHHTVTVKGTTITYIVSDTDPGSSSFRYDATTNTWYFNLQTKNASGVAFPIGDYQVTITPTTPGYLPSPSFKLTLTK